jgi:hypothetical protein
LNAEGVPKSLRYFPGRSLTKGDGPGGRAAVPLSIVS